MVDQFKEDAGEGLEEAIEDGVGFHALRVIGFWLSLFDFKASDFWFSYKRSLSKFFASEPAPRTKVVMHHQQP